VSQISMRVDGVTYEDEVEPRTLLVHHLRDGIGKIGTVVGCDTSNCGSCTVLLDGISVKSCTVLAVQADGCEVTTIEGVGEGGTLHPVQKAFHEMHGLQCGFCTPGMILAAIDLLQENPDPDEHEIREGIEGNLCRCTGYQNIVRAVQQAAGEMRAGGAHSAPSSDGHSSPAEVDTAAAPHVAVQA
jgi:aerobic carbon-monoxide dehydrogenase small subunit